MQEHDIVKSLAALAQAMRLRVFRALVVAGPEGLTPSALAEQIEVAASTLSFHLKELTHAGLISQERDGRHLIYRAQYEHMNALVGYLTEHCCQGQPCQTPAAAQACAPARPRARVRA
jgi:ArsR family transcriptional regulator, arsenate/arsenite/antimonite-responsive transcriptional repressor